MEFSERKEEDVQAGGDAAAGVWLVDMSYDLISAVMQSLGKLSLVQEPLDPAAVCFYTRLLVVLSFKTLNLLSLLQYENLKEKQGGGY